MVVVRSALGKHLFKLLLLLIIQECFDFRVRILPDGPCLGVAILHAKRSVGAQSLHLLLARGEDGRNLRHLIARQSQALTEMRGKPAGVKVAVLVAGLPLRGVGSRRLARVRRLREHNAR